MNYKPYNDMNKSMQGNGYRISGWLTDFYCLHRGKIGATIALLGLIAAGSDGEGFPWLNIAGLGAVTIVCLIAMREGKA